MGSTELVVLALLESGFLTARFSFAFIATALRLPFNGLPGGATCNKMAALIKQLNQYILQIRLADALNL